MENINKISIAFVIVRVVIMAGKLLKIGFIGGGKMAHALAKGFISAGTYELYLNAILNYQSRF